MTLQQLKEALEKMTPEQLQEQAVVGYCDNGFFFDLAIEEIAGIKTLDELKEVVASFREGRHAPSPIIVAKSIKRFYRVGAET
jgi:hypothetical protein